MEKKIIVKNEEIFVKVMDLMEAARKKITTTPSKIKMEIHESIILGEDCEITKDFIESLDEDALISDAMIETNLFKEIKARCDKALDSIQAKNDYEKSIDEALAQDEEVKRFFDDGWQSTYVDEIIEDRFLIVTLDKDEEDCVCPCPDCTKEREEKGE